jgi:hypothetical protein
MNTNVHTTICSSVFASFHSLYFFEWLQRIEAAAGKVVYIGGGERGRKQSNRSKQTRKENNGAAYQL